MALIPFDDRDGHIWFNGRLTPWRDAKLHVLTHALHYASAVFEGERAYDGVVFKSREHSARLHTSARLMGFEIPYSVEEIDRAKAELVARSGLGSHPLVRLAAAAEELASYRGNQSAASLETASQLIQLEGSIIVSLLADTTRSVQAKARTLGIQADPTMMALPWNTSTDDDDTSGLIDNGIARAALSAFSRSALIDAPTAWQDFNLASRLLLGIDAPVLFVKAIGNDGLTGAANPPHPGLTQIHIAADDAHSVIAEAYRDKVETRFQSGQRPPGRCAADWQLARCLDSDGLLCVPWNNLEYESIF